MFTFQYSINHPQGCWNVLESERPLHSWCRIGWRNTKIYIHRASWMEWKCGKCWKSPIFEGKLWVFFSYLRMIVNFVTAPYSSTFYSLFLPFFVLEIFKFKYDKFFVRHSASTSKFKWFEQLCRVQFWVHCSFWYTLMT